MVVWSRAGAPVVPRACWDAVPGHPSTTLPSCPHPASPAAHSALLFAVENPAHCEFPLLRDLLIR